MNLGNESGQIIIKDLDGDTVHDVRRKITGITSDGHEKLGKCTIKGEVFLVEMKADWKWYGSSQVELVTVRRVATGQISEESKEA